MKSLTHIPTILLCATLHLLAQTTTPGTTVVPRLVNFSGIVKGATGKPLSGQVAITFSLYSEQQGGSPLWSELQTVEPDNEGHYSVFLGAANASGLPLDLFTTGTARWLAVRPEVPGLEDPARILLVGVPYALKAADADTLGGKPASAYLTTESPAVVTQSASATPALTGVASNANPTGSGTTNYIPIWTSSTALGNSMLYQSGTNLGIGTAAPAYPLSLSSTGNTFPAGVSYLSQFVGSGSGNSAGTTNYRGLDFEISATGNNPVQGFTSITGDNFNSLSSSTLAGQSIFSANLRVNNAGNTTTGYGFQAIPILTSKGSITNWEAFDARTPSVSTAGGSITNSYAMYLEPQQVTGVTTGYGIYQAGTSDTNYLAGSLQVNGAAAFNGPVTFGGTSGLNLTGAINNSLTLQPNVTDTTSGNTGTNVIAGYGAGSANGNSVNSGVTGATLSGGGGYYAADGRAFYNYVTDDFGTVAGGLSNAAGAGSGSGGEATVGGGAFNTASGQASTVSGGSQNIASGVDATVAGGGLNKASGQNAIVAGGFYNTASGTESFAAGLFANATDNGSFVWCQTNFNVQCESMGTNSFVVSVDGPIYFFDGPNSSGCYLSSSSGSWTCSSDRNLKDHIQTIDPQSVLETLARMPISQWSMKADTKSNKHIGPMAQDFYAAFGLGETDKYIAQGDAQGVALASIQGLYQELKATKRELQQKDSQIREVIQQKDEKIQSLEERLQILEKLLIKK